MSFCKTKRRQTDRNELVLTFTIGIVNESIVIYRKAEPSKLMPINSNVTWITYFLEKRSCRHVLFKGLLLSLKNPVTRPYQAHTSRLFPQTLRHVGQ